tara:strand:+ start:82 stop:639 length:558 start_codon:yes stop_codon:yes gene_type:complete
MRIISGALKGRTINFLKNANTRPLKDAVKENIFNIIEHSSLINVKVLKSDILDLYSGIGSFGIECISRGASKVTFVEKNITAVSVLKENLINLSILEQSKIYNYKIEDFLVKLRDKFQIFFLDPPFKNNDFLHNLKLIKDKKLFKKKHIIIIHRETKTDDDLNDILKIIETKKYGRSKIIFGEFN